MKIHPGGNLTVPLECTKPVTDRMNIRTDARFHHRNANVYIPPSFVHNPNNKYNPKYMPLTIFNHSKVDHLYIGKDTVVTFADAPKFETYNVEITSEDKIKEHLAKPRHWEPQKHEMLPEIPSDTAFICSPADVQMYWAIPRFTCRTRKFLVTFTRGLKCSEIIAHTTLSDSKF